MDKQIIVHFEKNDPILFSVIAKIRPFEVFEPSKNYFLKLCEQIINQQLSGKAADTIFSRFLGLFPNGSVASKTVLSISDEIFRNVGMSWSKVRFIKNLAEAVESGAFGSEGLEGLEGLSDEEVIAVLTKVKGIGPWTAEMFLMFSLGRPDVFSHGDLGLRNAMKRLYKFKKEPTREQIEKIAKKWSPYRTYACRILWRSLEL